VASFRADRDDAIQSFGIVNVRHALNEGEDVDALELLRAAPISRIVFRDTHICPVDEQCPPDVVQAFGGKYRCGSCWLACKSIDHLPAIAAKRRQLAERIQSNLKLYQRALSNKENSAELNELYDTIEDDLNEYLAWTLTEQVLWDISQKRGENSEVLFASEPEIVRQQLQRVSRPCSEQEFVLRRIIESDAYPSLATDELRLRALKLKRQIIAGTAGIDEIVSNQDDEADDIAAFARFVYFVLRAKNLTLEQLSEALGKSLKAPLGVNLLCGPQSAEERTHGST
jgi:hypothetical protein